MQDNEMKVCGYNWNLVANYLRLMLDDGRDFLLHNNEEVKVYSKSMVSEEEVAAVYFELGVGSLSFFSNLVDEIHSQGQTVDNFPLAAVKVGEIEILKTDHKALLELYLKQQKGIMRG